MLAPLTSAANVNVTELGGVLNTLTVSGQNVTINLPDATKYPGEECDIEVVGNSTYTYAFATSGATGVGKWVGGSVPSYSTTTGHVDYFEIKSDGTQWLGVVADIYVH